MREANAFFKLRDAAIAEAPDGMHRHFRVESHSGGHHHGTPDGGHSSATPKLLERLRSR